MKKNYFILFLVTFCYSSFFYAQTAGTMSFTFTTPKHTTGNYVSDGRYVLAVWIESCTPCGTTAGTSTFVKTRHRFCTMGSTEDHLPTYGVKCGATASDCITNGNITGAISTGATQTTFTARTVTWDGTSTAGTLLADGSYRVCVQETWGHGTATAIRYFPFTKGTSTYTNTTDVASDTNFTNISLTWTPTLSTPTVLQGPDATVYPNPTNGLVSIDLKSEVKSINVVNLLGEVIYVENIQDTNLSRKVDLSNYSSGVYLVNISDDKGTSTYKILLEK